MKLFRQLAIATSLVLGLATLSTKSASAAIINYAFTVDSSIANGTGFFNYDDSALSHDNFPVALVNSLSFKFDNDPNVYNQKDDLEYPDYPIAFPTVSLTEKTPIGLLYSFLDKANPATNYQINGYDFEITSGNTQISLGKVSYREIPESSMVGGTIILASIGWFTKRKVGSVKKVKD